MGGLQWTEIYFSQFWMLRSQDQGHGQFSVWWEPVSWFIDNHFLLPFSHGRRGENTLFHGYGLITSRSHLQLTSLWLSVSTYDWGCKSDVYISSLILPLWICIHLFVLIFLLCWTDQSICLILFGLLFLSSFQAETCASIASIPIHYSLSVENRKEPLVYTNHPNSCTKRLDQTLA